MFKTTSQPKIRIVSHCNLFYWWPVWAVGFIMFLISMSSGHHLAVIPSGTTAHREIVKLAPTDEEKKIASAKKMEPDDSKQDALVYPRGVHIPSDAAHLHMSNNKNLGVLYAAILLVVIATTNIPLRGLWSVIVIMSILFAAIIFATLGWWETIIHYLNFLDIRINAAGYLVISSVLFVLWLIVMLLFDRQIYMIFSPGELKVCLEIGDAETVFTTTGMTFQKQRSDLFRHWILGIGSGDLIVKTGGANPQEFHMPNVLFIGKKVKEIARMMAEMPVVSGGNRS